ncbi:hypothetical protein ACQ4PT_021157 [Festuca glaucescens]
MPKGFDFWFGIDLNQPAGSNDNEAGTSTGHPTWEHTEENQPSWQNPNAAHPSMQHPDEPGSSGAFSFGQTGDATPDPMDTSERERHDGSRFHTGVTLPSEDSGDEGEVQSTPEGLAPRTPFVGMVFDSMEAALSHYNRYAHHVGFSVRIESSRKSTKDGEKDKSLFVCNKTGKNAELPPTPVKQRNRAITKLADCKAKLRVKRVGARWQVTQFVEEHTHEMIDKFALKKYLRSHNKILLPS